MGEEECVREVGEVERRWVRGVDEVGEERNWDDEKRMEGEVSSFFASQAGLKNETHAGSQRVTTQAGYYLL